MEDGIIMINNNSNMSMRVVVLIAGFILMTGICGCSTKELCLHPGCDNERIEGTGACYRHGSNASSNSYSDTESSLNSSVNNGNDKSEASTYEEKSHTSNFNSSTSNSNSTKYNTYGAEDYDDPDEYASDFAEDFAYDEFGYVDDYTYEYGYEEAYEYWEDEME